MVITSELLRNDAEFILEITSELVRNEYFDAREETQEQKNQWFSHFVNVIKYKIF